MGHRDILTQIFHHAVEQSSAAVTLPPFLHIMRDSGPPKGRTLVLGCGKAAAAMAETVAAVLPEPVTGCVVTRYGHGASSPTGGIEVLEAGHPTPDDASLSAGRRIREWASSARADDRVIFLISGGGSALLCDPIDGLSLTEKAGITRHLVQSGAAIADINLVRRHLSRVKGGGLVSAAQACGDMHSFLISDVAGDDPAAIASGPTIAAPFDPEAALDLMARYGCPVGEALASTMRAGQRTVAPTHPVHIIATAQTALDAAEAEAARRGWTVVRIGDAVEGDAAQMGRAHAALAMDYANRAGRFLLLSGGELTVQVKAKGGRGGPNSEYLTALMASLPNGAPVAALACDTDGIDGSADNAGGYFDADCRADAAACEAALSANNTYPLFEELGGLIITGSTRNNVNDIRMIAVEGAA